MRQCCAKQRQSVRCKWCIRKFRIIQLPMVLPKRISGGANGKQHQRMDSLRSGPGNRVQYQQFHRLRRVRQYNLCMLCNASQPGVRNRPMGCQRCTSNCVNNRAAGNGKRGRKRMPERVCVTFIRSQRGYPRNLSMVQFNITGL